MTTIQDTLNLPFGIRTVGGYCVVKLRYTFEIGKRMVILLNSRHPGMFHFQTESGKHIILGGIFPVAEQFPTALKRAERQARAELAIALGQYELELLEQEEQPANLGIL